MITNVESDVATFLVRMVSLLVLGLVEVACCVLDTQVEVLNEVVCGGDLRGSQCNRR